MLLRHAATRCILDIKMAGRYDQFRGDVMIDAQRDDPAGPGPSRFLHDTPLPTAIVTKWRCNGCPGPIVPPRRRCVACGAETTIPTNVALAGEDEESLMSRVSVQAV